MVSPLIWGIRWSVIFVLLLSGSPPEKYWEPLHLITCVFLFHSDLYVPGQKGTERWTHGKRCPPNHPSYEILCFCQGVKSLLSTDGQRIPLAWAARHPSVWRRGLRFCTYMPHFWVATEHVHLLKGHFTSRGRAQTLLQQGENQARLCEICPAGTRIDCCRLKGVGSSPFRHTQHSPQPSEWNASLTALIPYWPQSGQLFMR